MMDSPGSNNPGGGSAAQSASSSSANEPELYRTKGHVFLRRTYHKPTYCHCCGDMLWGLMNQGFSCIICNLVSHERCMRGHCLSPCATVLHQTIKTPAPHAFLEVKRRRQLFCSACRRRIDDRVLLQCELCETSVHCDCHRSALNNCRVFSSTSSADRGTSEQVLPASATHVWREGNLPPSSKCAACNKTCASNDCFSGLRCELCQLTVHAYCKSLVVQDCDYGPLSTSMLNPASVFLPAPAVIDYKAQLAPRRTAVSFIVAPEDDSGPSCEMPSRGHDDDSPVSSPTRAEFRHRFCEEQEIFVYDGREGLRRGYRKQLFITSTTSVLSALDGALRAFTMADDPSKYEFQVVSADMVPGDVVDPTIPLFCQLPLSGRSGPLGTATPSASPAGGLDTQGALGNNLNSTGALAFTEAIHLLLKRRSSDAGFVTFYADWIKSDAGTRSVFCTSKMTVADAIQVVLKKFDLPNASPLDYVLRVVSLEATKDREDAILPTKEILWSYLENLHSASLSSASLSRVYLGPVSDVIGDSPVSVFVGNLQSGRSQREYESAIGRKLGPANRWLSIEAIYYEHGAIVLSFPNATTAMNAVRMLRDAPAPSFFISPPPGATASSTTTTISAPATMMAGASVAQQLSIGSGGGDSSATGTPSASSSQQLTHTGSASFTPGIWGGGDLDKSEKRLICMCLPRIKPSAAFSENVPVLVLVNTRSGGCQGVELVRNFRLLLNPCQVFSLEQGGPLPALHAFRELPNYRILCCGGDGTVGWVLSCLDNVSQDSACQSPPVAIMPLGTGNDLSRVLEWGSVFTKTDSLPDLLVDVMSADAVNFDRWTISISPTDASVAPASSRMPATVLSMTKQSAEDNSSVLLMNNYLGIGIDAEVALAFHNAREEDPDKFKTRMGNKWVYMIEGFKKFIGHSVSGDLHKLIRIEVDGKPLDLPSVEGIVILNIWSWGSGCDLWGNERSSTFNKPSHDDGLLEIVGISGVLHLGQIQSRFRSATRLAQGEHVHVHLLQDFPVQVDGEPWLQPASHINVRRTALRAVMLRRVKQRKMLRRNTEPPGQSSAMGRGPGAMASPPLGTHVITPAAEESSGENK